MVLHLADGDVLCKTITLPLAAERDLAQVLSFEMDRETPFAVDEVRVGLSRRRPGQAARATHAPPAADRPRLPRSVLEALAEAGLPVTRMEIVGGADDGFVLPLDTDPARPTRRRGARLLRQVSVGACLALVLSRPGSAGPADAGYRKARPGNRRRAQRGPSKPNGCGAISIVCKAPATSSKKSGQPLAILLAALAALTAALPDDTYLTELQQQEHKVTFGGRSAAASQSYRRHRQKQRAA